jgi:murein DD-endopeptidase MepM/ murein hydrolase activator NlpD
MLFVLLLTSTAQAQDTGSRAILFTWGNILYAQSITTGELLTPGSPTMQPPTLPGTVYDWRSSPLTAPPLDDYGFYEGVWSPTRAAFAFLAIQPNGAGYQVVQVEAGEQRVLFADEVHPDRGYRVPVGWADGGRLVLLERHQLHNLNTLRLWGYSEGSAEPTLRAQVEIPMLRGNTAALENGWVFLGFETTGMVGYLVNINTNQVTSFRTGFTLPNPPDSVFEVYPLEVLGVIDLEALKAWMVQNPPPAPTLIAPPTTMPFLYWPLPDSFRSITCYPDSEWTDMTFVLECAGMTIPRDYPGHQGTDVGGRPNGLPPGTPVYAAARGLVVKTYDLCASGDVSCGDAYGNHVLLEHARVIDHNVEVWFTGYAHLGAPLVEPLDYIHEIGVPIALSGDTGLGGAHLHFEVRAPHLHLATAWVDPWDQRLSAGQTGLWLGDYTRPMAAVVVAPAPALLICQTAADNNIRFGPGTEYGVIAKTLANTDYTVFQIRRLETGVTPGDWYHLRLPDTDLTGWAWSDLMTDCRSVG